jgi:hypothetical protein
MFKLFGKSKKEKSAITEEIQRLKKQNYKLYLQAIKQYSSVKLDH